MPRPPGEIVIFDSPADGTRLIKRIVAVGGDRVSLEAGRLSVNGVRLFDPRKNEVMDPQALQQRKGYSPQQAVEIQTLTGDSTDNIRGVKGIGPKTAVKLIGKYGSARAATNASTV